MTANNKVQFRFIDLYSGIGGFRFALEALGGVSKGFSEIDKPAIATYKNNFNDPMDLDLGDVTKITKLPKIELLVGGVPCQSWSVAGKMRGFEDPRGRLWYDTIKMVEMSKPKCFIFENVKGLYDPRNRANLELIISSFEKLDYTTHYQLLNSYDFGLPQNRSRIFIVGFRKDMIKFSNRFTYPLPTKHVGFLADFLDGIDTSGLEKSKFNPREIFGNFVPHSRNAFQKVDELNDFFVLCDTRNGHTTIHSWDIQSTTDRQKLICMTFLRNRRKKVYGIRDGNPLSYKDLQSLITGLKKVELTELVRMKILRSVDSKYDLVNSKNSSGINGIYRIYMPDSKIFSTLTATGTRDMVATKTIVADNPNKYKNKFIKEILLKKQYREITAIESRRIQGFPDSFNLHSSDKQAKKQFGNAVSPPVVQALTKNIIDTGIFDTITHNESARKASYTRSREKLDALKYSKSSSQ
ncbi:MAG: DNA cytosine methyltransferase [Candidatus Saccharimonadales bacterium]